jgi:hypothetical protein
MRASSPAAVLEAVQGPFRGIFIRGNDARNAVVTLGAAVVGSAAFAGIYPRFKDAAALRVVIAAAAMILSARVIRLSLAATSPLRAFARGLLLAAVFGVATSVVALIYISLEEGRSTYFGAGLMFSVVFGLPTGAIYGVALDLLVALTQGHLADRSHAGADRAAMMAALWASLTSALVVGAVVGLDHGQRTVFMLPALALVLVSVLLLATTAFAIRRRRRFLARVERGEEPTLRVRALAPHDAPDTLPRITGADAVLEWIPTHEHGAYRAAAKGHAVALVSRLEFGPREVSAQGIARSPRTSGR